MRFYIPSHLKTLLAATKTDLFVNEKHQNKSCFASLICTKCCDCMFLTFPSGSCFPFECHVESSCLPNKGNNEEKKNGLVTTNSWGSVGHGRHPIYCLTHENFT